MLLRDNYCEIWRCIKQQLYIQAELPEDFVLQKMTCNNIILLRTIITEKQEARRKTPELLTMDARQFGLYPYRLRQHSIPFNTQFSL